MFLALWAVVASLGLLSILAVLSWAVFSGKLARSSGPSGGHSRVPEGPPDTPEDDLDDVEPAIV